ncbi:MAG: diaminopimelate epimerase [Bacteroidales bacterium]|nr:diaminopimelate epimerase [Bacteroidales bacterium]
MRHAIHFTKMQGAGNDYIYVDATRFSLPSPECLAVKWSDRHNGIGSDGLVLIGRASGKDADFSMRIFNADGSEAAMCGNASRCIGKYLYEKGLCNKKLIRLETASGVKNLWIKVSEDDQRKVESVTVDMLEPSLECRAQFSGAPGKECELEAAGATFTGLFVSMGNPHFVIFCENAEDVDICKYGPLLEHNEAFPERCNIEFAQVISPERIRTRVWERGSGVTRACGSGACATAVAASLTGRASKKVTIAMDGGELDIDWNPPVGHVYLSGPAETVFEGEIEYGTR